MVMLGPLGGLVVVCPSPPAIALSAIDSPRFSMRVYNGATRHTFASHYMTAGGTLVKLQDELGHSDVQTTQRYAKLSPDYRTDRDRGLLAFSGASCPNIVPTNQSRQREKEVKAS